MHGEALLGTELIQRVCPPQHVRKNNPYINIEVPQQKPLAFFAEGDAALGIVLSMLLTCYK